MPSTSPLEIFLLKDVLYKNDDLMNPSALSVRGSVVLQPTNSRVRKVTIQLLGKLSIQLPAEVKKTKREVFSQTVTLLENSKPAAIPSKSIYQFEFLLPGDLPDTFDCEIGKVEYVVKAVAETSLFSSDLKAERSIYIQRHASNYGESEDFCQRHKVFENQLECTAILPVNEFTPGEKFELNIKARPLAANGRITSASCFVKEVVRYQIPSKNNSNEIIVGEYLRRLEFSGLSISPDDVDIDSSTVITIPEANVSYECMNSLIEISHFLSIRFHTNTEVGNEQLVFDMPIMIVPTTGPTAYDQLPIYQAVELPPSYQAANTHRTVQEPYIPPPNYVC